MAEDGTGEGELVGFSELGDEEGHALGENEGSFVSVGFVGCLELGVALGQLELGYAVGEAEVGI
jgi:hypothetical protein